MQDERRLLVLADSRGDIADVALDAMTHLPLRIESWVSVRSRLKSRLATVGTPERRRYLGRVLRWVPAFEPDEDVEDDLGLPYSNGLNRRVRGDADLTWMRAAAPGCVLVSDAELSPRVARSKSRRRELRRLTEALKGAGGWPDARQVASLGTLDSHTVTDLFEYSSTDAARVGNALVAHIASDPQFRPELRGLFRVYRRTLVTYARNTGRQLGSWVLDDRDDESPLCWRAWQIAWTVSRGGIANVIAGLRNELDSADAEECVAGLALIADAADYCVQSSAVIFGGGAAPERLAPDDALRVFAESNTGDSVDLTTSRAPASGGMHSPSEPGVGPTSQRTEKFYQVQAVPVRMTATEIERLVEHVPAAPRAGLDITQHTEPGEPVDAAVYCPARVARTSVFLLQVFLYKPGAEATVKEQALSTDATAGHRVKYSLPLDLPHGTRLDLHLEAPTLKVREPDAVIVWRGEPAAAQFEVDVPADAAGPNAIACIRVALNGTPVGTLRFQVALVDAHTALELERDALQPVHGVRYRRAFVSYSSEDRAEVLRRVQAFKIAGISIFQDILDLDPGERWARTLYREIDQCDVFLLFWSRAAADSEWVANEINHALARKAGDDDRPPAIQPVPIEGPPVVPPPKSLSHLHFNDALLAHIRASDCAAAPRGSRAPIED